MTATTLVANAAMRSIVRRDTGESYQEFLTGLAQASGIKTLSLLKTPKAAKSLEFWEESPQCRRHA
ncbi:MAG: hypothetical protein ABSC63_16260 [Candidatus Binataceae bacterium]